MSSTSEPRQLARTVDRLRDAARAETVFGEPFERGDRTVVPTARVAFAFGGGYGRSELSAAERSQGGGSGGGALARPVGALEVTDGGTRFVRVTSRRRAVAALLAGAAVGWLLGRR